jgi:hypothetical protein
MTSDCLKDSLEWMHSLQVFIEEETSPRSLSRPSEKQLEHLIELFAKKTLFEGKVIPGKRSLSPHSMIKEYIC